MLSNRLGWRGVSLLLIALQGCATTQIPAEDAVRSRVEGFLAALQSGKREEVFLYATPAYRSVGTASRFVRNYAGVASWTSVEIADVLCEESACDVTLDVTYRMMRPSVENTRPLKQRWISSQGEWYLYEK